MNSENPSCQASFLFLLFSFSPFLLFFFSFHLIFPCRSIHSINTYPKYPLQLYCYQQHYYHKDL